MSGKMEEKAVHSWSRLSSAGKSALEEALRVFNPMSKDLTDTETQLVTFLQGLREEGYQPTILSSKDVYGYSSTTATAPPQRPKCASKTTTKVSSSKLQSKTPTGKLSSRTAEITVNSGKIATKSQPKNSTTLLLRSFKESDSEKSKDSSVGFSSEMYPGVYPAVRLSVLLQDVQSPASAMENAVKDHTLLTASKQSSTGKNKTYQYFMKQLTLPNGFVLNGTNGRILKENNACKASEILNGTFLLGPFQRCNGMTQTKPISKTLTGISGKEVKRPQTTDKDKKRKESEVFQEETASKKIKTVSWSESSAFDKDQYNFLKTKVIKVDKSLSDEEVRRRAQGILKVNLSPIVLIEPHSSL